MSSHRRHIRRIAAPFSAPFRRGMLGHMLAQFATDSYIVHARRALSELSRGFAAPSSCRWHSTLPNSMRCSRPPLGSIVICTSSTSAASSMARRSSTTTASPPIASWTAPLDRGRYARQPIQITRAHRSGSPGRLASTRQKPLQAQTGQQNVRRHAERIVTTVQFQNIWLSSGVLQPPHEPL